MHRTNTKPAVHPLDSLYVQCAGYTSATGDGAAATQNIRH
jgi:hypothetical protein